jgi:hypothetical protein
VDAGLHHLQGKAERVTDLTALLQAFHRDRYLAMLRHQAGARLIRQYDVNNTYQFVINRDDVQLSWLETALAELGAAPLEASEPERTVSGRGDEAARQVLEEDARDAQAFVDHWRPRVEAMGNARHQKMLRLVLGEVLEQKRFFEQALAGRTDLLGRRAQQEGPAIGEVLSSRWVE